MKCVDWKCDEVRYYLLRNMSVSTYIFILNYPLKENSGFEPSMSTVFLIAIYDLIKLISNTIYVLDH